MNINNLYEEVPVENDYDPIEYLPFGAIVTIDMYGNIIINSLLRPVTRESIEAFLREFGGELHEQWLNSELPYEDCLTGLINQFTHPAPGDKQ